MSIATSPLFRPALKALLDRPPSGASPPFAYRERPPIALIGPPNVGATMIARRLTWFMEPLADIERAWITEEHEMAFGAYPSGRPFRAPHHTVSTEGLVGAYHKAHRPTCPALGEHGAGGPCSGSAVIDTCRERVFRPGELQLARFGVLYLDELIEFRRSVIERLVHEWRAMHAGRPWIIASMNSCPCGRRSVNGSNATGLCSCPEAVVTSWNKRVREYLRLLGIDRDDPSRAIELEPFTRTELDEISSYKPPSISLDDIRDRVGAKS